MANKKEVIITCNATNVKAVIEGLERGMAALAKEEEHLLGVIKQRGYAENDEKKRLKEQKAKATKVVIKEIRLGPQTDDHDFEFKLNHAKRFLQEGSKVKVEVFFRGRSIVYKEQGEIMLLKFAQELEEFGKVEMMPKLEGKRMQMMIAPKSTKK